MDKLTRRNFIFGLSKYGILTGVIDCYFDQIILGRISKLLAKTSNTSSMNYIGFYMPWAPPRWLFDGVLEDNFTANNYVGTTLDRSTNSISNPYTTLNDLPPVWQHFQSMEKNTIMIRGVSALPVHAERNTQFTPRSTAPGVHAIASIRNGTLPLSSLQWGISPDTNHPEGKVTTLISKDFNGLSQTANSSDATEILEEIIEPFRSKHVKNLNRDFEEKIRLALSKLEVLGQKHNVNADILHNELVTAKSAFNQNLDQLLESSSSFTTSYAYYSDVVSEGTSCSIANTSSSQYYIEGIDDLSIMQYNDDYAGSFQGLSNFGFVPGSSDLRNINQHSYNDVLSTSLALAEILIENDVTNSMILSTGTLQNVGMATNAGERLNSQEFFPDVHTFGSIGTTYLFTKYYLGLGLGLKALYERLKLNHNFIFHLTSEFSRSARNDATGSDHGKDSSVHTLISPLIAKNQILGESHAVNDNDTYNGSWGWGGDKPVSLKKVHNTIAKCFDNKTYFDDYQDFYEIAGLNDGSSSST